MNQIYLEAISVPIVMVPIKMKHVNNQIYILKAANSSYVSECTELAGFNVPWNLPVQSQRVDFNVSDPR